MWDWSVDRALPEDVPAFLLGVNPEAAFTLETLEPLLLEPELPEPLLLEPELPELPEPLDEPDEPDEPELPEPLLPELGVVVALVVLLVLVVVCVEDVEVIVPVTENECLGLQDCLLAIRFWGFTFLEWERRASL
jgi:hypothetical protein